MPVTIHSDLMPASVHCLSKCPSECSDLVPLRIQGGSVRFSQSRTLRYNAEWFSQCPLRCRVQSGSVRAELSVTMQSSLVRAEFSVTLQWFSQVLSEQSSPLHCSGSVRFCQSRALRYNAVVQSGSVRAELSVTMQSGFSQSRAPLQCRVGSVRAELRYNAEWVQSGSFRAELPVTMQSSSVRPTPPKNNNNNNPNNNNNNNNNSTKTNACSKHTECNKRSPQTAGAQAPRCSQMIRLT